MKLYLLDNTTFFNEHVILCYLVAGGCGEFIASFIRAPAEAVKSRTQTGATISEAMQSNFQQARGRENMYRTWTVAIFRDIPFGAIQIALFESLKLFLTSQEQAPFDPNSLFGEAVLGACGGIVGSLCVTPLDVVMPPIDSTNGIRRRGSGKHFVEPRGRRGVDASHGKEQ